MNFHNPRCLWWAVFALCAVSITVEWWPQSEKHLYPLYDEVGYLDNAREIHDLGGIGQTIRLAVKGTYLENNQQPLYLFLLQPFLQGGPIDFPLAKLLSLGLMLILLFVVMIGSQWQWGNGTAILSGFLFAFSQGTAELSHFIQADVLFTTLFFLVCLGTMRIQTESMGGVLLGAGIGLAYLTKANGYFLFFPLITVGFYKEGLSFFYKRTFWCAIICFLFVAGFLLVRNIRLGGNPFWHFNNRVLWLDNWNQAWTLSRKPEWNNVGLRWFLRQHGVLGFFHRWAVGAKDVVAITLETLSFLPSENRFHYAVGVGLAVLGGLGIAEQWRGGHRQEIVTVLAIIGPLFLTLAFFPEKTARYVYPMIVLVIPFVAVGFLRVAAEWIPGAWREARGVRIAFWVCAAMTAGVLLTNQKRLRQNPLHFYLIPTSWRETSDWINAHVENRFFAMDPWFHYSSWFCCRNNTFYFPYGVSAAWLKAEFQEEKINAALVEARWLPKNPSPEKFGLPDEFGPTTFLGWPRCFHDSARPSHFLIYRPECRD